MSDSTLSKIKRALKKWCDEEKIPIHKDKKYDLCDLVWDNIKQFLGIGKYLPDDWEKYPPGTKYTRTFNRYETKHLGYPIDDDKKTCTCSYCEKNLDRNHFSDDEWQGSTDVWYQIILLYTTEDHPMGKIAPYPWYVHFCKRCCSLRNRWPKYFHSKLYWHGRHQRKIYCGPFKDSDLFYTKHGYDKHGWEYNPLGVPPIYAKYFGINTSWTGKLLRSKWSSLDHDDY